jgi:HSP20 family protein
MKMANISLYDPLSARFNRLFNNFFMHPAMFQEADSLELKLDVSENDKQYHIRVDIPGVKKEDIKVDVDGNRVCISAEVKRDKEEKKGDSVVFSERYEGKVYRSFTLDSPVDESTAQAAYRDGVLELTLPKKATGSTRRISIE